MEMNFHRQRVNPVPSSLLLGVERLPVKQKKSITALLGMWGRVVVS